MTFELSCLVEKISSKSNHTFKVFGTKMFNARLSH